MIVWGAKGIKMENVHRFVRHKKNRLLFMILVFGSVYGLNAQCAMCRAVLETSGDTGTAEAINNGIVYLMAIPYILAGVLFYVVYRKMKARNPET